MRPTVGCFRRPRRRAGGRAVARRGVGSWREPARRRRGLRGRRGDVRAVAPGVPARGGRPARPAPRPAPWADAARRRRGHREVLAARRRARRNGRGRRARGRDDPPRRRRRGDPRGAGVRRGAPDPVARRRRGLRRLRVLRRGGRLGLVWNERDDELDWIARLSEIVNRREGSTPRYRRGEWRAAFDAARDLFRPLEEAHFRHVHPLAPAGVVERVASISFIATMEGAAREAVLAEVRALLASHPDTAGQDELALAYRTDVFVWDRVG